MAQVPLAAGAADLGSGDEHGPIAVAGHRAGVRHVPEAGPSGPGFVLLVGAEEPRVAARAVVAAGCPHVGVGATERCLCATTAEDPVGVGVKLDPPFLVGSGQRRIVLAHPTSVAAAGTVRRLPPRAPILAAHGESRPWVALDVCNPNWSY